MKPWILRLCNALLILFLPLVAKSAEPADSIGLSFIDTPAQRLIYFDQLAYITPHALRNFANSYAWQRQRFGWEPSERVTVFLKDLSDYGNGAASSAPRNSLSLEVSPPMLAYETFSSAERMYALMNHELVHVATNDVSSESDRRWRRFFMGKVPVLDSNPETLLYSYLTVPRFTAPRWYLEGSASFMETWMNGGIGRAQGGYDEMVFRAKVRDGGHFYDPLGLASRGVLVDFQVGANAYLYGTRFFTWLALVHSPEKVVQWLRRDADSRRDYADQFAQVFGLSLESAWAAWVTYERSFQQRNLDRVREFPVTAYTTLTGAAIGSVSKTYFDERSGTLYGAFSSPGVLAHVGALDVHSGNLRKLADIKRSMLYRVASFAVDAPNGMAFYTNDNLDERDLIVVDLKSGESRELIKDARIGELAFNPTDGSLYGVRHDSGLASLVRIPPPYTTWSLVHEFPYGTVPSDLDISPDGKRLAASVAEVNADQFVRVWDIQALLSGEIKPLSAFKFGQSVPEGFSFSRDGRYLFGSSYYTGVSNIFRYEVASGDVEAVSNADVGFFRPAELADGRLLVLTYTDAGFVPATIDGKPVKDVSAIRFLGAELAEKRPLVTTWQVPSPATVDEEKLIVKRGTYLPLREMGLANAYPVLQGYKSQVGLGYRFNFSDPIQFANFNLTLAMTPRSADGSSQEVGHLMAEGRYMGWRAGLAWNKSDFYDLFGPTKRSRKGQELKLGYDHFFIFDLPRKLTLSTDVAFRSGLDTLPEAQNVSASFTRLLSLETKLDYTNVSKSLGAVDDEKGLNWLGALNLNRSDRSSSAQLHGELASGLSLPWLHTSLWSRSALGWSSGSQTDPMTSYYFGGFGNNYVDRGEVKRYREFTSMPGFELNEIAGRRFAREQIELNLPPYVFESVGTPGLHLSWMRPALFATALWTAGSNSYGGSGNLRRYANFGGQLDFHISTLHWYEMIFSVGYAQGYQGSQRKGNEWMLSLKIF